MPKSLFGVPAPVEAGYKALSVKVDKRILTTDIIMHGPFLGLTGYCQRPGYETSIPRQDDKKPLHSMVDLTAAVGFRSYCYTVVINCRQMMTVESGGILI